MILAVDIGNTNIKMALFKGERILRIWRITTDKDKSLEQYKRNLSKLLGSAKVKTADLEAIIICSVVPKLTLALKKVFHSLFKKRPLILGQDIIAPIKNLYKKPEEVGQDRLANASAAVSQYTLPLIVVDFGTALTFDLVSQKGSYLGGLIAPGMELSLQALIKNADLLPEISLAKPRVLLGRDTISSMNSGIVYGYIFLVEGILKQLKTRFKKKPQVIVTGGEASLMFRYCKSLNKINLNLTLEGLRLAYKRGSKSINIGKKR